MALDSKAKSFGWALVRAACRYGLVRMITLSLAVVWALTLQGCLAGVWVAAVAVDTMRSSNVPADSFEQSGVEQAAVNTKNSTVTFEPFERSWVAWQDQSGNASHSVMVRSVAVLPPEGDPDMGERLTALLQEETSLRVESPSHVVEVLPTADPVSGESEDADRSALAKELTRNLGVDTVLVSRITDAPSHPTDWGRKPEGARRLYLYLVNRDGQLLWKDELPFTVVPRASSLPEVSVQRNFTHHVMQHVRALRLDEIGYLPNRDKPRMSGRPSAIATPIE